MASKTVFISGASGFIALHTIDILLSRGYKVIGTVRSSEKGDLIKKNFKEKYPEGDFSYEIVKDIAEEGAFDEALKKHKDIQYVLHTASPFSYGFALGIEDAYLKPAVNGTLNILKGIKEYAPQVDTVVVTSSFAAIANKNTDPKTFIHDHNTWNPITYDESLQDESSGYLGSKTFAERAAREFVENEKPNFKVTTVNPPLVFGPQVFTDSLKGEVLNTSAETVNRLLKTTAADNDSFPSRAHISVDVRDVALFHVLPLEDKKLSGERLFITQGKFSTQRILNIINEKFPELRGKIAVGYPENLDKIEEDIVGYDHSNAINLTGVEFISLEKSIYDAVSQILKYNNFK